MFKKKTLKTLFYCALSIPLSLAQLKVLSRKIINLKDVKKSKTVIFEPEKEDLCFFHFDIRVSNDNFDLTFFRLKMQLRNSFLRFY